MRFDQLRKPLVISCLVTSIVLHVGVFYYFSQSPSNATPPNLSSWKEEPPLESSIDYHNVSNDLQGDCKEEIKDTLKKQPKLRKQKLDEVPLIDCIEYGLERSLHQVGSSTKNPSVRTKNQAKKEQVKPSRKQRMPKSLCKSSYTPCRFQPAIESTEEESVETSPMTSYDFAQEEQIASLARTFLDSLPKTEDDFAPLGFSVEGISKEPIECPIENQAPLDLIESLLQLDLPLPAPSPEIREEEILPCVQIPSAIDVPFILSLLAVTPLQKIETPTDLEVAICQPALFSISEMDPYLIVPKAVDYFTEEEENIASNEAALQDIDYYGLSEQLSVTEWDEEVDADISYMPHPNAARYIFSVTLHPRSHIGPKTLPQHFYFLINYSSSIEKQKFTRYKRAVQRALSALNEHDTFNIFFFDKLVTRLSERNLPVHSKTLQKAQDFLEQQGKPSNTIGNHLALTLDQVLPEGLSSDEVHSVIFISDGIMLINNLTEKKTFLDWLKMNSGVCNFYCATSGKGNDLALLDLLSYSTAGKLLYSDTNAGFPRKLVQLVKDLHNPIMKDLSAVAIPHDNDAQISLTNAAALLPPMFANSPYTLVGTTDELKDFQLFIQGKCGRHLVNIKKKISFKNASEGGYSLTKLWADCQATTCYEQFLKSGKNTYLREARELVAPHGGTIALD